MCVRVTSQTIGMKDVYNSTLADVTIFLGSGKKILEVCKIPILCIRSDTGLKKVGNYEENIDLTTTRKDIKGKR